jgi:uncharacterized protein (UPF0261 family)
MFGSVGVMKRILPVGTADTKGEELGYLRSAIADAGGLLWSSTWASTNRNAPSISGVIE